MTSWNSWYFFFFKLYCYHTTVIFQYNVSICVIWGMNPDSLLLVVYGYIFHHFIMYIYIFKVNVTTTCVISTYHH
jgi:hypothetical protein